MGYIFQKLGCLDTEKQTYATRQQRCGSDGDIWRWKRGAERCREMEFSLYGGDGGEMEEVLATFNYLDLPLD